MLIRIYIFFIKYFGLIKVIIVTVQIGFLESKPIGVLGRSGNVEFGFTEITDSSDIKFLNFDGIN